MNLVKNFCWLMNNFLKWKKEKHNQHDEKKRIRSRSFLYKNIKWMIHAKIYFYHYIFWCAHTLIPCADKSTSKHPFYSGKFFISLLLQL